MLLADLVATSATVAGTRSRTAKAAALAELLRRLEPEEVAPAAGFLVGEPRQGRIGVGWATLVQLDAVPATTPTLTVLQVDGLLNELQHTTGAGSQQARARLLGQLLGAATEPETHFLHALLGGELRQGALEGVMVEAVAEAAGVAAPLVRRALLLGGDLGETARLALDGGAAALAAVRLQVLRPLRPMLASTAAGPGEALAAIAGPASVEWKLDGARIQVHRQGGEVRVFTRNLNEVTHRLPEVATVAVQLPVHQAVLDGETLTLGEDGRPRLFQDTMSRFGADEERAAVLRPFFFDLLHVDGRDLVDEPLHERLRLLQEVAGAWTVPGIVTADPAEASAFLEAALATGHEGVMVKALDSPYEAGRRGRAWLKVKPVRTLDLVVLAVEWGHGRRQGWLSNLHLGARDPQGGFVMVGKTFKGLTDQVLAWQTERFLALASRQDRGTVWVRPEQVVEIALDGVQVSSRYPGGVALRFARVVRYRDDKDAGEADTIDTVRALLPGVEGASGPRLRSE